MVCRGWWTGGGFPHKLCVMWKHKCAINSSLRQTCSLTALSIIDEFPLTCWCHTDSGWLCNNPPPPHTDFFLTSVSTSNGRFISVCFANTEAQMASGFTSVFWCLWRRHTCGFSATITTVHLGCRIWVFALNANLFVWAESRSAGTSSRFRRGFSSISQGETESKQQASRPASWCPCVLQHGH